MYSRLWGLDAATQEIDPESLEEAVAQGDDNEACTPAVCLIRQIRRVAAAIDATSPPSDESCATYSHALAIVGMTLSRHRDRYMKSHPRGVQWGACATARTLGSSGVTATFGA